MPATGSTGDERRAERNQQPRELAGSGGEVEHARADADRELARDQLDRRRRDTTAGIARRRPPRDRIRWRPPGGRVRSVGSCVLRRRAAWPRSGSRRFSGSAACRAAGEIRRSRGRAPPSAAEPFRVCRKPVTKSRPDRSLVTSSTSMLAERREGAARLARPADREVVVGIGAGDEQVATPPGHGVNA